ncbi:MAG: alpha/beta hydrolase-fold protein [Gemmatimonadota bacterium]
MSKLKWGLVLAAAFFTTAVAAGSIGGVVGSAVARSEVRSRSPEAGTEVLVNSDVLGESVSLRVFRPAGLPEATGPMPVLWVSDGSHQAGIHLSTIESLWRLELIPPMTVVAIPSTSAGRSLDFRPPQEGSEATNAEAFLAFIRDEAMPAVAERLEVEAPHVFVGYSLGGLFASWAFTQGPDVFDGWIAVSPSWWYGEVMMEAELSGFLDANPEAASFLYTSLGDAEGSGMMRAFERVNRAVGDAAGEGLTWVHEITPGADHGSNPALSSARALQAFWSWHAAR